MKAFHNDPKVKKKYLMRVMAHERADEIVKGQYWQNGKGCAVGCTIHSGVHADYETELGIPQIIARLEDGIFENIPNELAKTWPRRFLEAIKPGADLSGVWPNFAAWMLTDEKWGVLQFAKTDQQREAIHAVADFYTIASEGEAIDVEDWREVRSAAAYAYAYAAYAAYAAANAAYAAAYAADAAAYAADAAANAYAYAAYAAAYAADAAANAAYAADAAREKWRIAQSEKLLELLRDADLFLKSNEEIK